MNRFQVTSACVLLLLSAACVTETVPVREAPPTVPVLDFPTGVLPAGAYHGVTFYFEIHLERDGDRLTSRDLPEVAQWNEEEMDRRGTYFRQLPPIVPKIAPGGREIYRVRDIHRVDYHNSMFYIGKYRYLRMPMARLYMFKKASGNFTFKFRGQPIVVPATSPWIPSVYYYPEHTRRDDGKVLQRDVLLVGLARIETRPDEGHWLVNGKRYFPESDRPLALPDALHSVGRR